MLEARLNITYQGQQGDLQDPVQFDLSDAEIRRIATEALQNGDIRGISPDPNADVADFVVDRFPAREDVPVNRLSLRPKTPFGGSDIFLDTEKEWRQAQYEIMSDAEISAEREKCESDLNAMTGG